MTTAKNEIFIGLYENCYSVDGVGEKIWEGGESTRGRITLDWWWEGTPPPSRENLVPHSKKTSKLNQFFQNDERYLNIFPLQKKPSKVTI